MDMNSETETTPEQVTPEELDEMRATVSDVIKKIAAVMECQNSEPVAWDWSETIGEIFGVFQDAAAKQGCKVTDTLTAIQDYISAVNPKLVFSFIYSGRHFAALCDAAMQAGIEQEGEIIALKAEIAELKAELKNLWGAGEGGDPPRLN